MRRRSHAAPLISASDWGGELTVDMKAVKARKDAISGQSRTGVESWMKGLKSCTVYEGHGHFLSPREIAVGNEVLAAEKIFINVGGRASVPPFPGLEGVKYLTNSSMMDVDFLPEHLVIIGGSYVGLEFAQMYRRFGSAVTVIEMQPRLIGREDEDVSAAIAEILEQEGIDIRLNAKCLSVARHDQGISVSVDCTAGPPQVVGSHLLLAVGRRPNTDDLGLDKAGVIVDKRGYIEVDDQLRTNVRGIWAPKAPSRTLLITTSRSLPRTSSTTIGAVSPTACSPMHSTSIPPWVARARRNGKFGNAASRRSSQSGR
jgi:pyruvate/2-oxoglutarate dehydrogenase complex dihydrolipoamide dehydrogenase (E3) component